MYSFHKSRKEVELGDIRVSNESSCVDKTRERCGTKLRCSCLQVENPGFGRCDGNDCIMNLIIFASSPTLWDTGGPGVRKSEEKGTAAMKNCNCKSIISLST